MRVSGVLWHGVAVVLLVVALVLAVTAGRAADAIVIAVCLTLALVTLAFSVRLCRPRIDR